MDNSPQTPREASGTALAMEQDDADIDRLVTTSELCSILRVSRSTLYRLLKNGSVRPPLRLGQTNRWLLSEVRAFVDRLKAARDMEVAA